MIVLFIVMLVICFCATTLLIFHPDYDDGVVGKLALGAIQISSFGVVIDSIQGAEYQPLGTTQLFVFGATIFLLRFIYRWESWRMSRGKNKAWKEPSVPLSTPEKKLCFIIEAIRSEVQNIVGHIRRR